MPFCCIIQQYLVRVCVFFFTMFGSTTAKQPTPRILVEVVVAVVLSDRLPPKRFRYCCQWKPRSSSRFFFVWSISAAFSAWCTAQAQDELCVPHNPLDYPLTDNWPTPPSHVAVARHLVVGSSSRDVPRHTHLPGCSFDLVCVLPSPHHRRLYRQQHLTLANSQTLLLCGYFLYSEAYPANELPLDDFFHGGAFMSDFHDIPSLERPCYLEMKRFIDQEGESLTLYWKKLLTGALVPHYTNS